jgi:NAD(P)-dependent dehydrogenase (short-subunit alcohol dehydrogenase family)
MRAFDSEAEFINADVRREDDVRARVDDTVARFGRLDVAVNNAGTEGQVGPITEQAAESSAATFGTSVLGVIPSMKHEVRVMQGQGSDGIINISSTYGHEAAAGASIYVGSKHAVEGVAKPVATRAGPVVAAGGFDRDGAMATVKSGDADLLAFGRYFTSNPDLPYRLKYNLHAPCAPYSGAATKGLPQSSKP